VPTSRPFLLFTRDDTAFEDVITVVSGFVASLVREASTFDRPRLQSEI
jgi:hypothetical protein